MHGSMPLRGWSKHSEGKYMFVYLHVNNFVVFSSVEFQYLFFLANFGGQVLSMCQLLFVMFAEVKWSRCSKEE